MGKYILFIFGVLLALSCSEKSTESGEDENMTGTIRDVEGNVYQIVRIGNQWWMAENLKTTKYRNGEWIINVTGSKTWPHLTTGAYCFYNNSFELSRIYGNLYNWEAVHDRRNLAPEGWHVPTDDDWQELVEYLGGDAQAGGKMKSIGTVEGGDGLWAQPNEGATNECGFSALPGGYRSWNGHFGGKGNSSYFWSSTETSSGTAYSRYLLNDTSKVYRYDSSAKQAGYSIRCVKD